MARHEVGVEMGEKDVADFEAEFLGVGQVLLNVALRVDDDRGRTRLVAQQIGGVSEAAQIILFQNHGGFYSLAFRRWRSYTGATSDNRDHGRCTRTRARANPALAARASNSSRLKPASTEIWPSLIVMACQPNSQRVFGRK